MCAAGQPARSQVIRGVGLSASDREYPALTGRSGTQRARACFAEHLIRRSGRTVQGCPVVAACWPDVPGPSFCVDGWLWPWLQSWLQSRGYPQPERANPNRISSSARGCPDRFNLDQPPWSVFAGWPRTVVNCNPNCNLLIRSKITPVQRRPQLSDRPAHAGRGGRSAPRSSEVVHGGCSIRISEMCWQGRCCACLLHCSRLAMRRLPCQCLSRRIRPTSGRCRCRPPCTPGLKTSCALVAATALVRTPAPVPARPASAGGGGGTVSAGTIPGSMRPTPLDSPYP